MSITPGFGKRVELVRRELGLTQWGFARLALSENATVKNISRIEKEEVTPKAKTLAEIANFGDVDVSWLATGECILNPNDVVRTAGIGERIAQARQARGMTRRALAEAAHLGASSKNISRLEAGEHRPLARTLTRIAETLKVSPRYLAYGA